VLVMEGSLPAATIKELERRGHKVEVGPDWSEGRLSAASQEGVGRKAAANTRGMQGYAAGRYFAGRSVGAQPCPRMTS
jgi:gamma-glutamyltranspeptidase/glutathione hydrolase